MARSGYHETIIDKLHSLKTQLGLSYLITKTPSVVLLEVAESILFLTGGYDREECLSRHGADNNRTEDPSCLHSSAKNKKSSGSVSPLVTAIHTSFVTFLSSLENMKQLPPYTDKLLQTMELCAPLFVLDSSPVTRRESMKKNLEKLSVRVVQSLQEDMNGDKKLLTLISIVLVARRLFGEVGREIVGVILGYVKKMKQTLTQMGMRKHRGCKDPHAQVSSFPMSTQNILFTLLYLISRELSKNEKYEITKQFNLDSLPRTINYVLYYPGCALFDKPFIPFQLEDVYSATCPTKEQSDTLENGMFIRWAAVRLLMSYSMSMGDKAPSQRVSKRITSSISGSALGLYGAPEAQLVYVLMGEPERALVSPPCLVCLHLSLMLEAGLSSHPVIRRRINRFMSQRGLLRNSYVRAQDVLGVVEKTAATSGDLLMLWSCVQIFVESASMELAWLPVAVFDRVMKRLSRASCEAINYMLRFIRWFLYWVDTEQGMKVMSEQGEILATIKNMGSDTFTSLIGVPLDTTPEELPPLRNPGDSVNIVDVLVGLMSDLVDGYDGSSCLPSCLMLCLCSRNGLPILRSNAWNVFNNNPGILNGVVREMRVTWEELGEMLYLQEEEDVEIVHQLNSWHKRGHKTDTGFWKLLCIVLKSQK